MPELINDWLTPRGFAYWFMDDGSVKSSESKGVVLNTQAYTPADIERLIEVLQDPIRSAGEDPSAVGRAARSTSQERRTDDSAR